MALVERMPLAIGKEEEERAERGPGEWSRADAPRIRR